MKRSEDDGEATINSGLVAFKTVLISGTSLLFYKVVPNITTNIRTAMLSTVDQIICRLLYFRSGRFGLKSNTVSIVLGVRKVKEVMESETRVGIELLGKLKRKADKYRGNRGNRGYIVRARCHVGVCSKLELVVIQLTNFSLIL